MDGYLIVRGVRDGQPAYFLGNFSEGSFDELVFGTSEPDLARRCFDSGFLSDGREDSPITTIKGSIDIGDRSYEGVEFQGIWEFNKEFSKILSRGVVSECA